MKVKIKNLTLNCIIGILPDERINEQRVIINASFEYNYVNNHFINYAEVTNEIKNALISEKFELIEESLEFINNLLNNLYKIENLDLEIIKPDILDDCVVSVSL